ncbi:MAG: hypothetical protein IJ558_13165 [Treponema sp.]|nr:hypothetical protein [Treponema sp.]
MEELAELETLDELDSLPELPATDDEASEIPSSSARSTPTTKPRSQRLPILLRLTRRMTVFLSFTLLATILFFLTGNKQGFLDTNLQLLLSILASNAIALAFFSGLAILECIFYIIKDKKFVFLLHIICYLIILSISVSMSLFSLTVNLLSEGFSF